MNAALVHRGPDDEGTYLGAHVGLAMRRLSIIDVAGGHQPVTNENGTIHVVFNGEIYNYRELLQELETCGHTFRSRSDTEVIAHGFEQWGLKVLDRLRGMFAIGIWDALSRQLILAVDRLGIKPLYYCERASDFAFASELPALSRSGLSQNQVDEGAIAQYFTFGFVPYPASVVQGVSKLPPGHFLIWRPHQSLHVAQYWALPPGPRQAPFSDNKSGDARAELRRHLREAVRAHLVSDVPVGAFLSGGIDSSAVVALMRESGAEDLSTYSIGFDDLAFNELPLARQVAHRYATKHHEYIVRPDSAEVLPELAAAFGEPFADASALPTHYVAKQAARDLKVVLSGDGGDEVFIGYQLFLAVEMARRLEIVPGPVRAGVRRAASRARTSASSARRDRFLKRLGEAMLGADKCYEAKAAVLGLARLAPLLSPEFSAQLLKHDPVEPLERLIQEEWEAGGDLPHDLFSRVALRFSLPGDMLVKVDRASMANSLEVRVPLLDHHVVEFALQLPVEERITGWRLKSLLKATMADALPPDILGGRKRGFSIPLVAWLGQEFSSFAADVLLDPSALSRGYYNSAAVAGLLSGGGSLTLDSATVVWSLVMFELWIRSWSTPVGPAGR